jgi:hypothetical protein
VPVSSPSYFPPNSSTDQVRGINAGQLATGAPLFLAGANAGKNSTANSLIIIGDNSGSGGIAGVNPAGTIIMGDGSAAAFTGAAAVAGGIIVIGTGSLPNVKFADTSVFVGHGILPLTTGATATLTGNVLIGTGLCTDSANTGPGKSVIIGYQACHTTGNVPTSNNVVIGYQAFPAGSASSVDNVLIGFQTCQATPALSENVILGSGTTLGATGGTNNVVIGFQAAATTAVGINGNIAIGSSALACVGPDTIGQNIVIGSSAQVASGETTGLNIIIGPFAGRALTAHTPTVGSVLLIETNNSGGTAQKGLIFGQFPTGNIMFGNSISGTSQDFGGLPGTNMVKLLNGTAAAGANITNGGYFYVLAGVLHWVDSSGNDTTLSVPAAPTTGASTATFVATNKPGATTGAGPVAWENRVIDGVSYQSPLWAT